MAASAVRSMQNLGVQRRNPDLDEIRIDRGDVPVAVHESELAIAPLPCHAHRGMMEICYLVSGRQAYRVGGQRYILTGNDVFVTFPDERHDSGMHPQDRGRLYWMHLRLQPPPRRLPHLDTAAARELTRRLLAMPVRHFRGSDDLRRRFEDVFALLEQPARRAMPSTLTMSGASLGRSSAPVY